MVTITGSYQGQLHCEAIHGPSGAGLSTDAPVDNRGRGEAFSPTDLAATALVTCMATIMGMKAADLGVDLTGLRFEIGKTMSADTPRRIARLDVTFWMPSAFDEVTRTKLERAAATCPVHHSLHPDIAVNTTFHWDEPVVVQPT